MGLWRAGSSPTISSSDTHARLLGFPRHGMSFPTAVEWNLTPIYSSADRQRLIRALFELSCSRSGWSAEFGRRSPLLHVCCSGEKSSRSGVYDDVVIDEGMVSGVLPDCLRRSLFRVSRCQCLASADGLHACTCDVLVLLSSLSPG